MAASLADVVPPDWRHLGFIVKVSERCNIACTYCYFFFHDDKTFEDHPSYMKEQTLDELVELFRRVIVELKLTSITVGLHGGEPTMAPRTRIDAFCRKVHGLKAEFGLHSVSLNMQTNGMLLSDEWVNLIRRYRIGVGVSIDGTPEVHDARRIDKKGRGTYDRAIAGFQRLKLEAKRGGVAEPGYLGVMDHAADGGSIFRHAIGIGATHMNMLMPDVHFDDPAITEEYVSGIGRFMIEMFRAWTEHNDPGVHVRFIDEIVRPLQSDTLAQTSGTISREYRHFFTVASNGEIGPEDTIKTLAPRFRSTRFQVKDASLAEALRAEPWNEIGQARETPPPACAACDWWGVCRGGGIVNRFSEADGFANPSVFCSALQTFYAEVAAWLVEMGVSVTDIDRRLEIARLTTDDAEAMETEGATFPS